MFAWYEMFLITNLWSPRTSLDMTSSSNFVSKSKLLAIVVIRLLCFVFIIRSTIAFILPQSMSKYMIYEYFQFYGNPTPIHIGFFSGGVCAIVISYLFQSMLFNGKSKIFRFLNKIKTSSLKYNLNKTSERKFKIRLLMLSFLCLPLPLVSIVTSLYLNIGLIVVYLKEDYNLIGN